MIERIGTESAKWVSMPCKKVLSFLEGMKQENRSIVMAEVGVGVGATTVEIMKYLDDGDTLHLFDFEEIVSELKDDLEKNNEKNVQIIAHGCTRLRFDSYNWALAKMTLAMQESGEKGVLDLVYLDVAHSFFHDTTAVNLLKLLLKKNGVIVFDDYSWSLVNCPNSEENCAKYKDAYTAEQMATPAIEMVCKLFMDTDEKFEKIGNQNSYRPAYRKNAD